MADKDWDKELAKIDKQLASLSDEALTAPAKPTASPAKASPPAKRAAAPTAVADVGVGTPPTKAWAVYARLLLSVALGGAMMLWPYEVRCGTNLAAYLAAVVVVVSSGVWSAVWTWRHRASRSHSLSLLIILWGLILGSLEVLPRIGYAKPDARHPATWSCS